MISLPKFASKIDDIYIMRGTTYWRGNTDYNLEYNFHADSEAIHRVFKEFKMITLTPLKTSPEF